MNTFFKDLKIVELANVLAGPATGSFFSELGAEVIKIENKLTNGDVTRSWKLASEDKDPEIISAYYASANWNKKSIFLDLTNAADRQIVYDHVKTADILICNYKAGDDIKLGMDQETIRAINPTIIYASISGFGEQNERTAFDLVLQAETGFMYMNGNTESGPMKMPVALIDLLAAHQLKEGILTALIKKLKTGEGSGVSVSLYDAAIASLANQASNWLMAGEDPQPIGSLHPNIAPYGETFITKDQQRIVLAVGNNKQFKRLCSVLNTEELDADPAYATNTERVKNRKALSERLQALIQNRDAEMLMQQFIREDVPAGLIKSLKKVFEEPSARALINNSKDHKGLKASTVKTVIFKIK